MKRYAAYTNIETDNKIDVVIITGLLPCLSLNRPKNNPPNTLPKRLRDNVPKTSNIVVVGLRFGKKITPFSNAKIEIKIKSKPAKNQENIDIITNKNLAFLSTDVIIVALLELEFEAFLMV